MCRNSIVYSHSESKRLRLTAQNGGAVGPQAPSVLAGSVDHFLVIDSFLIIGSMNVRLPKVGEPKHENGQ